MRSNADKVIFAIRWGEWMRFLTQKSIIAGALGFSSSLPLVFLTGTLAAWLAELGMSMATIGFLSWITLTHGFKILWAPLIRSYLALWIAGCQLGLAISLIGLAAINPASAIYWFALAAFVGSLFSATQDTAFEAWRIKAADDTTPVELIMTASQLGSRIAVLVGGAAALSMSGAIGWSAVCLVIAALFAALSVSTYFTRNLGMLKEQIPDHGKTVQDSSKRESGWITGIRIALVLPVSDLKQRFGIRLPILIAFVLTYTLSWFSWAGFTLPLYLTELGYTKNEVAVAARIYGSVVTTVGILCGSLALLRFKRFPVLLIGALLPIISNLTYGDLSNGGAYLKGIADTTGANSLVALFTGNENLTVLYLAVLIKNLISGASSAIFVGHLASLVSKEFAVMQCAFMSSLSFVTGTLFSAIAGHLIDKHGFSYMTYLACLIALFAAAVVLTNEVITKGGLLSFK